MRPGIAPVKPGFEPAGNGLCRFLKSDSAYEPGADPEQDAKWRRLLKLSRIDPNKPPPGPRTKAELEEIEQLTRELDPVLSRLEDRRFKNDETITEPVPVISIVGRPVCTPGNITNIIAQAKAGKSTYVAALIAAAICAEHGITADTLGVSAVPPGKKQLIHIDTEQSRFDAHQLILRAMKRAGLEGMAPDWCPAWLSSFSLAGLSADELREALVAEMMHSGRRGVYAVILDGAADLVTDVNDAQECNAFVASLHALAIKLDCPIICVVHENPGSDSGKMRGHLGSQLERKAESNLRLKKDGDTTVVYSEKMRRAPIFESEGPRFAWSDQYGMHVSVASAGDTRNAAKRAELAELAAEVFKDKPGLRYAELLEAILQARKCSQPTAERRIKAMKELKVITIQGFGIYSPSTINPPSNEPS